MKPIDLFCLSACILSGIIYAINCIVTQKASWRGRSYEGKDAIAAGWAILFIFVLLAVCYGSAILLYEK